MSDLSPRQASLGIALISLATLMFELFVNKALSFSTWGTLGYMIIGSAIFGFSVAGVVIGIWQPQKKHRLSALVSGAAFLFSISVAACYIVMNVVPFNFEAILDQPAKQVVFFTIWYLTLLVPFSMTGFIVALLLMSFKDRSNRLYAADLLGAGVGCILVVPAFPLLGAAGLYLVCAALGAICTCIFAYRSLPRLTTISVIAAVLFLAGAPLVQQIYPVKTHQEKRERGVDFTAGRIRHAMWSFLSKIEVAMSPERKNGMIWFDGGLMQSAIDRFDGDFNSDNVPGVRGTSSIAYRLKPRKNVLIIAPAGGRELRTALAWGAEHVTGVELDYSVVQLVQNELNDFLGGIYHDERVTIVNDEGRSFIRRGTEKYDVIQFISAYSVAAVQSGAVDLAGSYLATNEAFDDYLSRLTPDGVLSISLDSNLRLFYTAWTALERRDLDPRDRLILLRNDEGTLGRNTILVKLTPFEEQELQLVKELTSGQVRISYAPDSLMSLVDSTPQLSSEPKTRKLIEEFIRVAPQQRQAFYDSFPYRVAPVSDDRPFYNSRQYFGRDIKEVPERMTEEVEEYTEKTWYLPLLPIGSLAQIVVLVEAGVFALLFLIFPLWIFRSEGIQTRVQRMSMLYFLSLGLGFIWIEIVLLKKFILFLGSPVYSIAVVLFAVLIFAGLGSLYSERLQGRLTQKLRRIAILLVLIVLTVNYAYPSLFAQCLGLPFAARILVAVALIAPIGFVLGIPFPLGLSYLGNVSPESIPWAWAMNGYATVVGVSSSALVAMQTGFATLIALSLAVYLLGFACLGMVASRNE